MIIGNYKRTHTSIKQGEFDFLLLVDAGDSKGLYFTIRLDFIKQLKIKRVLDKVLL